MSYSDALPATVGRYRIESVLGRGAMGMVYRAYDPAIGRRVAIKLVRADLLQGSDRDSFLARFQQEAQAAGRCMHPNIVTIHDFAVHDGNPFLAMEYVDGASLAAILKSDGRLAPERAIPLVLQVLSALDAAHALGIVHRDVKPANVLVLPDDRVKVTDFGIARLESTTMTQSGAVIGTPSYMSPEQYRGDSVDARSDVFSTGAVLFELLAGERPFPGRNMIEIGALLLHPAPIDAATRLSGLPESLIAVVARALAKLPEQRFASAAEMAAALRSLQPQQHVWAAGAATTVQAPRRSPQPDPKVFDSLALARVERKLAAYVGPIARHLVWEAAREATTLESLCNALGHRIDQPAERAAFLRSVLQGQGAVSTQAGAAASSTGSASASRSAAAALPPAITERVERDLAAFLGPIARVLVRRAAAQARSEVELREHLAERIEDPRERTRFLARAG